MIDNFRLIFFDEPPTIEEFHEQLLIAILIIMRQKIEISQTRLGLNKSLLPVSLQILKMSYSITLFKLNFVK